MSYPIRDLICSFIYVYQNNIMKKNGFLILTVITLFGINSCEKDTESLATRSETFHWVQDIENDIYYRLSDGLTTPVARATWDIAFSVAAREAAILTNGGSGVTLKAYPVTPNWTWADAIDTTGYHNWTALNNSDTTWVEGAFNMNATGHPNYGWGVYNEVTHNLNGVSLYIISNKERIGQKNMD